MFTTLSTARRFHVVSFVLAAVCFAAMLLFCQNAVMGQEASGEETAVAAAADVGENNSGGQEEGTAENSSDQSNSENDPADSSKQGNATNKTKGNLFIFVLIFVSIVILWALIKISFKILYTFLIQPYSKKKWILYKMKNVEDLRLVAAECIKFGTIIYPDGQQKNKNDNIISMPNDFLDQVFGEVEKQQIDEDRRSVIKKWFDNWTSFNCPNALGAVASPRWLFRSKKSPEKRILVSKDDFYLLVVTSIPTVDTGNSNDENNNLINSIKNNYNKHRKKIFAIYNERFNAYRSKIWYDFLYGKLPSLFIIAVITIVIEYFRGNSILNSIMNCFS